MTSRIAVAASVHDSGNTACITAEVSVQDAAFGGFFIELNPRTSINLSAPLGAIC
jgi:hypothetical protein